MLVPIELPDLGMGVVSARVTSWLKTEGESIAFGEVICTVTPHERGERDRDRSAATMMSERGSVRGALSLLKKFARRLRRIVRKRRFRKRMSGPNQRVGWEFRVIASESGTLGTIKTSVGSIARLGDALALFETPFDTDEDEVSSPRMRVVVELIDRAGQDSGQDSL